MKYRWLFLLLSFLLLIGCAPRPTDPQQPIRVRAGREFTIVVEANPTTGYEWRLMTSPDEALVHLVEHKYQPGKAAQGGAIGAGGYDIWRFEAVAPGETTISLGLYPPSKTAVTPTQILTFTVQIR